MPASRRRHQLGQHFLTDQRVLERQLRYAEVGPEDTVLEIGPGLGVLTKRLSELAAKVVAIELDANMVQELRKRGLDQGNVTLVHGDAVTADYASLGPFTKIVANLPYSASSPITFRLLQIPFQVAVLMYQREFAERLVADHGDAEYGRLSAARAYFAQAEILENVPRGAFSPPPDVGSALVKLTPFPRPPFSVASPESYLDLLRLVFSTRRKTLRSTLRHQHAEVELTQEQVDEVLTRTALRDRRPEELPPSELGRLDQALHEAKRG